MEEFSQSDSSLSPTAGEAPLPYFPNPAVSPNAGETPLPYVPILEFDPLFGNLAPAAVPGSNFVLPSQQNPIFLFNSPPIVNVTVTSFQPGDAGKTFSVYFSTFIGEIKSLYANGLHYQAEDILFFRDEQAHIHLEPWKTVEMENLAESTIFVIHKANDRNLDYGKIGLHIQLSKDNVSYRKISKEYSVFQLFHDYAILFGVNPFELVIKKNICDNFHLAFGTLEENGLQNGNLLTIIPPWLLGTYY